jgi:hypothetical protein
MELWLPEFAAHRKEPNSFLFEDVVGPRRFDLNAAIVWSSTSVPVDAVRHFIRQFASRPPLCCYDYAQFGLTGRSLRHVLPAIAVAVGIGTTEPGPGQFSLGNWKSSASKGNSLFPSRFVGSELDLTLQAKTRLSVSSDVRSFVGELDWQSRWPLQLRETPSFAFLCTTGDEIDEFSQATMPVCPAANEDGDAPPLIPPTCKRSRPEDGGTVSAVLRPTRKSSRRVWSDPMFSCVCERRTPVGRKACPWWRRLAQRPSERSLGRILGPKPAPAV